MHRIAFLALALLAAGGAWWLKREGPRSSFGAYSDAQLDTLEAAYRSAMHPPPGPGADSVARQESIIDAEVSLEHLQKERTRRRALLGAAAVALLAAIGALLPGRRRSRASREEDQRLARAIGDPAALLEAERRKAAGLLGVAVDAPPAVVDAALAARLAAREPSQLEGLDPGLQRVVLEQREALRRARDLLVTGTARRGPGTAPQQ
jgi:hypothetical protein